MYDSEGSVRHALTLSTPEPTRSKAGGASPPERGRVWVFLLLSGWLPSLSVQPTIQVNRTCGRGDGLSPEMVSPGGQAQLCKPAVYSSQKGQAAMENSPAQLPPRQRHPSVFASCGLSPPDSGAGSAFGPEK